MEIRSRRALFCILIPVGLNLWYYVSIQDQKPGVNASLYSCYRIKSISGNDSNAQVLIKYRMSAASSSESLCELIQKCCSGIPSLRADHMKRTAAKGSGSLDVWIRKSVPVISALRYSLRSLAKADKINMAFGKFPNYNSGW